MIRTEMVAVMQEAAGDTLPSLIDRAARTLTNARSAAEVLEARDMAAMAYDVAKRAARLAKAKNAHDALIAAAHRSQADALLIESQAKRRLADEYDAAQDRREIRPNGAFPNTENLPNYRDAGMTAKQVHEARKIRDAEARFPGIAERAVQAMLDRGAEPTRSELKRVLTGSEMLTEKARKQEREERANADFKALRKAWNAAGSDGRNLFREWLAAQK